MQPFYVSIYAVNQANEGGNRLLAFDQLEAAVGHIQHWLTNVCGVTCLAEGEEGDEFSVSCPTVEQPLDLECYNGNYSLGACGSFALFLMVIDSVERARRFQKDVTREYELDKTFSDEADAMMEALAQLVKSFEEPVDTTHAVAQLDQLLRQDGLSLF